MSDLVVCSNCGKPWPHDPRHYRYPDLHPCAQTGRVGYEPKWWHDHDKLALLAWHMKEQGDDTDAIIYMLEKPWKYDDEYAAAVKDLEDSRQAEEVGG